MRPHKLGAEIRAEAYRAYVSLDVIYPSLGMDADEMINLSAIARVQPLTHICLH